MKMRACKIQEVASVLERTLKQLVALQDPQLMERSGAMLSAEELDNTINKTLEFSRELFDMLFTSLHGRLELFSHEIALSPQLELVCNVMQAAYHRLPSKDTTHSAKNRTFDYLVIEPLITHLFTPIYQALGGIHQQRISLHGLDRLSFRQLLLSYEEALASILTILYTLLESEDDFTSPVFKDLICLVLRIYEHYLLPWHLLPGCTNEIIQLITGLELLLQHLKKLHTDPWIQRTAIEFVNGLYKYDLLVHALRCSRTTATALDSAICRALVTTITEYGNIFIGTHDSGTSFRQGDRFPSPDALMAINRVVPGMPTMGGSYNLSTLQKMQTFRRTESKLEPKGVETRPFTFLRIMSGIRQSICGPEGGFCKRVIEDCLQDILPWIWRHNWNRGRHGPHPSDETFQELHFPVEPVRQMKLMESSMVQYISLMILGYPSALCSMKDLFKLACHVAESKDVECDDLKTRHILYVLCSIVRMTAVSIEGHYDAFEQTPKLALEPIASWICTQLSSAEIMPEAGSVMSYFWQVFDSIVPLLNAPEGQDPLLKWEIIMTEPSAGIERLLLYIETIQNEMVEDEDVFYCAFGSTLKLLIFFSEHCRESIFDDDPQALPSLWVVIQEIIEESLEQTNKNIHYLQQPPSTTQYTKVHIAILGTFLLVKTHLCRPHTFWISADDLAVIIWFAIAINKFLNESDESQGYVLAKLVTSLIELIIRRLHNIRGQDMECATPAETRDELLSYLDLLVDTLTDILIGSADSRTVWRLLVGVYANSHEELFINRLVKHAGPVLAQQLLQRWILEATLLQQQWRRAVISKKVLPDPASIVPPEEVNDTCEYDSVCGPDENETGSPTTLMYLLIEKMACNAVNILTIIKLASRLYEWRPGKSDSRRFQFTS
ncbi:hypothetical protein BCR41DRAFT_395142 [Lobosporangium transversale]|uniref:Uncharacterized protein n=1 Tax=Lobosporangium transversale TaxID=64571 RepID=A0A1Y2GVP2_9FUNG|nr:hypothetical protein BCR41DRAFT_395142 [Lobosporangium transversale]ORZ20129.1 hypothetical protein BCR41DRAFT_395142 [Lobosporangium transversale]|eukprot:XP_021882669.1 hypothetical protein BCR41DRAFT_395142 [Lobosporangium transversale]